MPENTKLYQKAPADNLYLSPRASSFLKGKLKRIMEHIEQFPSSSDTAEISVNEKIVKGEVKHIISLFRKLGLVSAERREKKVFFKANAVFINENTLLDLNKIFEVAEIILSAADKSSGLAKKDLKEKVQETIKIDDTVFEEVLRILKENKAIRYYTCPSSGEPQIKSSATKVTYKR